MDWSCSLWPAPDLAHGDAEILGHHLHVGWVLGRNREVRIEQADGDGQVCHDLEQPDEIRALDGWILASAARPLFSSSARPSGARPRPCRLEEHVPVR
jgi:hypothetical protein